MCSFVCSSGLTQAVCFVYFLCVHICSYLWSSGFPQAVLSLCLSVYLSGIACYRFDRSLYRRYRHKQKVRRHKLIAAGWVDFRTAYSLPNLASRKEMYPFVFNIRPLPAKKLLDSGFCQGNIMSAHTYFHAIGCSKNRYASFRIVDARRLALFFLNRLEPWKGELFGQGNSVLGRRGNEIDLKKVRVRREIGLKKATQKE
jgi:hypothetical protein